MFSVSDLRQSGRNICLKDALYLGWSGSFIEFLTDTRLLSLLLCSDASATEEDHLPRIAVYVDDLTTPAHIITLRVPEIRIVLPVSDGHVLRTVRIMRLTESAFGLAGIRDLQLDPGAHIQPTSPKSHRIEFIGDSITCGYGIEAFSPATFTTLTENPVSAYAVLTANALNADYSLVAWSGIGVVSSWVEASVQEPNQSLLMSRLYPYHCLRFAENLRLEHEPHDFVSDPVDLVVINLGTNDSSWTRGIPERVERFASAYYEFLELVHAFRPNTPVLCILGTMGQDLCNVMEETVHHFRSSHPNAEIHSLRMPVQQPEHGLGADGHPTPQTHRIAADRLIACIRSLRLW